MKAHVAVISRTCHPSPGTLGQLATALGQATWSWIYAGLDQSGGCLAGANDAPLYRAPRVGLVAGRHAAIGIAGEADIIIYLDDDVRLPRHWLPAMLEPFTRPDVHFVGCRYLPEYEHEPPDWLRTLSSEQDGFTTLGALSLLDGGRIPRWYSPLLVWGLCFAVRRATLLSLRGFHPDGYPWELRRFRGDGETGLALKAEAKGYAAWYQGDTHVWHRIPRGRLTPYYLERRAFLEGISNSYSNVRRTGRAESPNLGSRFRRTIRSGKWQLERARIVRNPTPEGIQRLISVARVSGVRYHQHECREDSNLLEWVLKPEYLDPSLPSGWQQYLSRA